MKKVVLILLTVMFAASGFAKEDDYQGLTYEELSASALSIKKINEKKIESGVFPYSFCVEAIPKANMKKDLDSFCYLLETCYAGYDEAVSNGFDIEKYKADILEKFKDEKYVKTSDFIHELGSGLFLDYVRDNNFYFINNDGDHFFGQCSKNVFFTDIYVRKSGSEYIVVESAEPEVKKGQKYTGNSDNLFYYPLKGKDVYRVGDSFEYPVQESFQCVFKTSFDNKEIIIEKSFTVSDSISGVPECTVKETPFSGYVRIPSFAGSSESLERFRRSGYWYQNRTNCILDLRGVKFGDKYQGIWFLTNLYISQVVMTDQDHYTRYSNILLERLRHLNDESLVVYSPLVAQANFRMLDLFSDDRPVIVNARKLYNSFRKNSVRIVVKGNPEADARKVKGKLADPFFKGKLIILVNGTSCAVVEEIIAYAKELFGDQVVLCGTSTMGGSLYSCNYDYKLPESGLMVSIPRARLSVMNKVPEWKGVEYGLYPDVWATDEDINETVVSISGDEALRGKF